MPSTGPELPRAYYLPLGDGRFEPTEATMSPWDQAAQHGGPPTALLAVCLDDAFGRPAMRVARISMDFLGPVPRAEVRVQTSLLRPGKRTQLSEATLWAGDRPVAVARVWHLAAAAPPADDNADADADAASPPVPDDLPEPQPQRYFGGDDDWGYGRAIFRLTAKSDPGHDGIGLTEGTLADAAGRCGTVTQPLLVAPR